MNSPAFSNASADLALAVYLEPHADQRRVLLLGHVDAPLAAQLERLAAHLDIIDPSVREGGGGEVPELPFDDESFDLILVAELAALPEPRPDAIRELRRVLSRDGLLAVGSPAVAKKRRSEPSAEGGLERLLGAEFRFVRVMRQTPMLGYTLSDSRVDPEVALTIDSSLVRARPEQPERLVALGSDVRVALEPRLWVQLPAGDTEGRHGDVDPRFVEALQKAEEEARLSSAREAELLRDLARERKLREAAEATEERTRALERKLLAIEADYDDAVGRVRYFEGLLLEREAAEHNEQEQVAQLEKAHGELARLRERLVEAEADVDAARLSAEAAISESADSERRLAELGGELSAATREAKRHEGIARDLLEELRGLEQRALVAVEHDARVAELEAERERAMQRALEAEVARESAQMRVDELRAQVEQPRLVHVQPSEDQQHKLAHAQSELDAAHREQHALRAQLDAVAGAAEELAAMREARAEEVDLLHALRGERTGLRFRLSETEDALISLRREASAGDSELDTRLALAEARAQAALEALSEAEVSVQTLRTALDAASQRQTLAPDTARLEELEAQLAEAARRADSLERELEEADRFAEDHAEDAERADALSLELDATRQKLDALEDEVRALSDDLFSSKEREVTREQALADAQVAVASEQARANAEIARVEAERAGRMEQLLRRESELRAERDDAHAALAEARAILSHLAVRVGADAHDLPGIMQALDKQTAPQPIVDSLRAALADAQSARSDSEYQLSRANRLLEEREARIRDLEASLHSPHVHAQSFEPPEV